MCDGAWMHLPISVLLYYIITLKIKCNIYGHLNVDQFDIMMLLSYS